MPRLFLGTYLNQNDQTALGQLPQLNSSLEATWNCRLKWSKPNQLHLTWIFFGNVEVSQIDQLCQTIKDIVNTEASILAEASKNISLRYENLECWFNHKTPSLLALVPVAINPTVLNCARNLRNQLSDFAAINVRQQAKNIFKPHITLARLATAKEGKPRPPLVNQNQLALDSINGLAEIVPLIQAIDSISLIESNKEGDRHQYSVIKSFPFKIL